MIIKVLRSENFDELCGDDLKVAEWGEEFDLNARLTVTKIDVQYIFF
jgi:hypothetical protein